MARTVTIAERDFAPGSYSRTVDSFPQAITKLQVTLTQPAPWPGTPEDTVAFVDIAWEDGTGGSFGIPGGQWTNKQGQPSSTKTVAVFVPRGPGGVKRNPIGGTGTFRVIQALRAALTIEAL